LPGLAVTALLGLSQSAATARELLADHLLAATRWPAGLWKGSGALVPNGLIGPAALGLGDAKLAGPGSAAWLGCKAFGWR